MNVLINMASQRKWTVAIICNSNEKSIKDGGFCNSKLTTKIQEVVTDENKEYILGCNKKSNHDTFFIKLTTSSKH